MSALVTRRPFASDITQVTSPIDADVVFDLKKIGVAENIQRKNMSSKVRYIMSDETGEAVSERDFPVGDMELSTLMLALVGWNLKDENENPLKLTPKNVTNYLHPREFSFLYKKVLELNPILSGEDEEKND